MNNEIKCPHCGGSKFIEQGNNSYKCLYCGSSFTQAPTPPAYDNTRSYTQNEMPGTSNIVVNVNVPNNTPNNIGEPLQFHNIPNQNYSKGKSKTTAGLFGILLGGFGAHHFYLGNIGKGVVYLLLSWLYIPAIIGFIEGIVFLCMNDSEFDRKYNCRS